MKKAINILSNKPFKIFYNGLVPRSIRYKWDYLYKKIPTAQYWHDVIDKYTAEEIDKYNIQPKKDLGNKKIIWQYWAQGFDNLPAVVELGFRSVDTFKGDYEVIRLTDSNVSEYIEFPKFVYDKRENNSAFGRVFFSDLLRTALINAYGGIWLDATILLTDTIPCKYQKYDLFMFSRDPNSEHKKLGDKPQSYFNWDDDFPIKHLNSIIFGQKKSQISSVILDLLLHFWKTSETIPHYFFFQIMFNELQSMNVVDYEFLIEDDTLPHLLQGKMNEKFNVLNYNEITKTISIHKLTLNDRLKEKKVFGALTYFGYIKQSHNNREQ